MIHNTAEVEKKMAPNKFETMLMKRRACTQELRVFLANKPMMIIFLDGISITV